MASGINIYDITNSNRWYQQFELLISVIEIADMNDSKLISIIMIKC